jgi:hypothetical protein
MLKRLGNKMTDVNHSRERSRREKIAMLTDDIYVQVTASAAASGKSRSVVVLVPRANRENYRREQKDAKSDDNAIARLLAEPLAEYSFTHRTIFSVFEISHTFFLTPPREIEGRSPNLSQSGLKAWILS